MLFILLGSFKKPAMDFLLVITELYSLGVTATAQRWWHRAWSAPLLGPTPLRQFVQPTS